MWFFFFKESAFLNKRLTLHCAVTHEMIKFKKKEILFCFFFRCCLGYTCWAAGALVTSGNGLFPRFVVMKYFASLGRSFSPTLNQCFHLVFPVNWFKWFGPFLKKLEKIRKITRNLFSIFYMQMRCPRINETRIKIVDIYLSIYFNF